MADGDRGAGTDTVGPWKLLIILVVLVTLVGSSRLPRAARSLGEGLQEFRSAPREAGQPAGPDPPGQPSGEAAQQDRPASPGG